MAVIEPERPAARPNQVSRTGHPASSAVRLNRSWMRNAQTTPQWSRNQNQRPSNPDVPADARSALQRATQTLRANVHATHSQTTARRSGRPVRSSQAEIFQDQAPAPGRPPPCRTGSAGNWSRPRRPAVRRRASTGESRWTQGRSLCPAHPPAFFQPGDQEDDDQQEHQAGPDPLAGRAGVEHRDRAPPARRGRQRYVSRPAMGRPVASGSASATTWAIDRQARVPAPPRSRRAAGPCRGAPARLAARQPPS